MTAHEKRILDRLERDLNYARKHRAHWTVRAIYIYGAAIAIHAWNETP